MAENARRNFEKRTALLLHALLRNTIMRNTKVMKPLLRVRNFATVHRE